MKRRKDDAVQRAESHSKKDGMIPPETRVPATAAPDVKTLEQSLSLLRAALDSTADGILVVDSTGRIADYNDRFVSMWRIPPDIINSKNDSRVLEFVISQLKDPEFFLAKVRMLYDNPHDSSLDLLEFKDGRIFQRSSRPQLLKGRHVGRVWSFSDITAQKRIEAALRLKNLVFDTSIAANSIADLNGIITEVNSTFLRVWGYQTKDEVLGKHIQHFLCDPGDVSAIVAALNEAGQWEGDYTAVRKDGSNFIAHGLATTLRDEAGNITGYHSAVEDISEHKRVDEALRTSEYWLKESQRVSRVGSYVTDIPTGKWTSTEVLDEIFGIDANYSRTVGGWAQLVHPDDRQRMTAYFANLLQQKGAFFDREYRIVRKNDGQIRWVLGRGAIFLDKDQSPVMMAGTIQDITERKQSEEERLRMEAQILQTQKLESLGLLAGGIAHDFNNMLMVILGSAELAYYDIPEGSPAKLRIEGITNVAKRAAELCNQMLTYAGKGLFLVERINPGDLVRDMMQMLTVACSKKATLHCDVAGDLPAIEADPTQVRQIIMNLVINASEALGNKTGDIAISIRRVNCDREFSRDPHLYGTITEGPYVSIDVKDNGCGIDDATMVKIFDPFFTTKFTGRGLGLAAVRGILRAHKGAIRIRSEVGRGSTFTVLFPASMLPADSAATRAEASQHQLLAGDGPVLLVDDEEDVLTITRLLLEKIGCEVLTATGGRQAIELFRQHRAQIRCVLLDLTMPEMDGEQTFVELKKLDPNVHVILSSGYGENSIAVRFSNRGIAGFIHKPYQLAELKAVLQKSLR